MWFYWIGAILISSVQFIFKRFTFGTLSYFVLVPFYSFYVALLFISFGLFYNAVFHIVNSIFDLLNMINTYNNSVGSPPFACFFYLLDALGIADALKNGISLIVSDILGIITIKATAEFFFYTGKAIKVVKDVTK